MMMNRSDGLVLVVQKNILLVYCCCCCFLIGIGTILLNINNYGQHDDINTISFTYQFTKGLNNYYDLVYTTSSVRINSNTTKLEESSIIQKSDKINNNSTTGMNSFCWRDMFVRGIGTYPDSCTDNQYKDTNSQLCYDNCPDGFNSIEYTYQCQQRCPDGWQDDGLFCRLAEYWRGEGYASTAICERHQGVGNCERWGLFFYPKCRQSYMPIGCCICRPQHIPDCAKAGLGQQIDLSCWKKIRNRVATGYQCNPTLDNTEIDLCYRPCGSTTTTTTTINDNDNNSNNGIELGVGPVCSNTEQTLYPSNWTICSFGASANQTICDMMVHDPVLMIGQLAITVTRMMQLSSGTMKANEYFWDVQIRIFFQNFQSLVQDVVNRFPESEIIWKNYNNNWSVQQVVSFDPYTLHLSDTTLLAHLITSFTPCIMTIITTSYNNYPSCRDLVIQS